MKKEPKVEPFSLSSKVILSHLVNIARLNPLYNNMDLVYKLWTNREGDYSR